MGNKKLFGVYSVDNFEQNQTRMPEIKILINARNFHDVVDAIFPCVKSVCLPFKDYCVFSGSLLHEIPYKLQLIKDFTMKHLILIDKKDKEFMVDLAIQRCVENIMK